MTRIKMRPMLWAGVVAVAAGLAIAAASAQTVALKRLMQQKLEHSQGILAAVTTSNWGEMQRESEALLQVTRDPAWMVMKTPEYATHSEGFVRAAEDLLDAARRRDLEAAPLAYVSMTLSCVQCHRYVARARIAGAIPTAVQATAYSSARAAVERGRVTYVAFLGTIQEK